MVLKAKGRTLLKELLKYLVVLVLAGVVGYLAGHWGTGGGKAATGPLLPGSPDAGSSALESRLAKLERKVDQLRSKVGDGLLGDSLEGRVSTLERNTGASGLGGFGSLESRVSSLEGSVRDLRRSIGSSGSSLGGFGSLESRVSSLESSLRSLESSRRGY